MKWLSRYYNSRSSPQLQKSRITLLITKRMMEI